MHRVRRFLNEWQRRRMFRAVAAWGFAVFAALQVAEPVAHGLHLPEWTVSAVVVGAIAGTPVMLVLAWFFDLRGAIVRTPERAPSTPRRPTVVAAPDAVQPGAMTALLEQLAHAPEVAPTRRPVQPGDRLGRYEVLREVGRGGFGVVFEARDHELGRSVALKAVQAKRGVDPGMLRAEAEAAAQLQHPNIVTVHDVGTADGEAWIVLELLRGETLEQRLHRGPVPADEVRRIATEIARGLAHAHRAGVVHRDLKPANVFLCEDGAVKILDFGLSRLLVSSGRAGGTPGYMAPEVWREDAQDERVDVFAVGVILFELLTGRRPYAIVDGRTAALDANVPADLPARLAPRALRRVIESAIEPDPARRPRDGAALLEALLSMPAAAAPHRARRAGFAAAALLLVAGGFALWRPVAVRELDDLAPGDARIPIAVADVQNGTSDPELNGLSGMLVTSLEQSRRLLVLTRSRLVDALRQLGREPPEVLDESLAREVGRTVGVRALLLATVHRFDDRYAIELRALDPVRNEYLFTLKEEGKGKSSVPDLIDRLARRTRERLREEENEVEGNRRAVAELTTGNLAAYEHFFRARQAIDLRRFDRARDELEAALRIDPAFALAHYGVVVLDSWTHVLKMDGPTKDADAQHLARALQDADRLPEKERLSLLAWKATVDGRTSEAMRLRDEAAQRFPQDKDAVFWAGDVRFHDQQPEAAIPFFERALALDPDYRLVMEHLYRANDMLGRREAALAAAQRWADAAHDAESRVALASALWSNGRQEAAIRAYKEALPDGPWPPREVALQLARAGRPAEAEAQLRASIAARRPLPPDAPNAKLLRDLRASQDEALVAVVALQGRWREAARLVDAWGADRTPKEIAFRRLGVAMGSRSPEDVRAALQAGDAAGLAAEPGWAGQAAAALALAGDLPAARARLAAARAMPEWQGLPALQRNLFESIVAVCDGRGDEAERALGGLLDHPAPEVRFQTQYVLGELAARRGDARRAIELLESVRGAYATPSGGAWPWLYPRTLLMLAQAYERAGDLAHARERVDALLALWRHADPGIPPLADAHALARRVSHAAPRAVPVVGGG